MSTRVATSRFRAPVTAAVRAGAAILAVSLALPAAAHAQTAGNSPAMGPGPTASSDAASPVMNAVRQVSQRYQRNLVGSAEEMPADKYAYKPTPQQMSFGQLMLHVATSNEFMCSSISGQPQPKEPQLDPTSPKAQLVARLKESFSYCADALAKVDDGGLSQQVPFFGNREVTRATAVMGLAEDWADHYGQAAMYLRLNGMLPPSAQRRHGM